MSTPEHVAPMDVRCPACGADKGEFCRGSSGRNVPAHRPRVMAARGVSGKRLGGFIGTQWWRSKRASKINGGRGADP